MLPTTIAAYNQDFMQSLKKIDESVQFNSKTNTLHIENLTIDRPYPALPPLHIVGNVMLSGTKIIDFYCIRNILSISGSLIIQDTGLTSINGLNDLQRVGTLKIIENNHLYSINGFTQLQYIHSSLIISENKTLKTINGLGAMEKIAKGDLHLTKNPSLEIINGIKAMRYIGRSLILKNMPNLRDIVFLSRLAFVVNIDIARVNIANPQPLRTFFESNQAILGYLKMVGCGLSSLTFMQGLTSTGGALSLQANQLTTLKGLESLNYVGNSLSLSSNKLSTLSQLLCLTTIDGHLGLASNRLRSLTGLENLRSVRTVTWRRQPRTIAIFNNKSLMDIQALQNIEGKKGNIIVIMDSNSQFYCKPDILSPFSNNNILVISPNYSTLIPNHKVIAGYKIDTHSTKDHVSVVKLYSPSSENMVLLAESGNNKKQKYIKKILYGLYDPRRYERELSCLVTLHTEKETAKLISARLSNHQLHYLFEYHNAISLREHLSLYGPLSTREGLKLLQDMATILIKMAKASIIHADIWPGNILYDGADFTIIDFGRASYQGFTPTRHTSGNHKYAAPEIYRGKQTYASDIYSLGCTLYFAISGSGINAMYNFKKATIAEKVYAHIHQPPWFSDDFPEILRLFILCMVEKNSHQRITAHEILHKLNAQEAPTQNNPDQSTRTAMASLKGHAACQALAEEGIAYAQNILGIGYEHTTKDLAKASYWYTQAAKQNVAEAQYNLAMLLIKEDIRKNLEPILYWAKQASQKKYSPAQYLMGYLYEENYIHPVMDNKNLAISWYREAAENGNNKAQKKLLALGFYLEIVGLSVSSSTRIITKLVQKKPHSKKPTPLLPNTTVPAFPCKIIEHPLAVNPIITAKDVNDRTAEFVADPFLVKEQAKWYLFYEVMDQHTGRGVIALSTSHNGITWQYEKTVLIEDFHLSYPYVFNYNNQYYMIPETYQKQSIRVYQATQFPYQWHYVATILCNKKFVDASLFQYKEKLWLFASEVRNRNCYLYYSDTLLHGWQEHPLSPVIKEDKSKARPAGRIFQKNNGPIIRTTQKCDQRYGQRVRCFEVVTLSETCYQEVELPYSPILSETGDTAYHHRVHHFDGLLHQNNWYIVSDRKGKKRPWVIDLYTDKSQEYSKYPLFVPLKSIASQNEHTDSEGRFYLKNLIEGPGIGFKGKAPYPALSKNAWSTPSSGQSTSYFEIVPTAIHLDFEFAGLHEFEGIGIWINRYNFANSVKEMAVYYSVAGLQGLSQQAIVLQAQNRDPKTIELFRIPKIKASFVRITIRSNHYGIGAGGDRVGLQEVVFITNYQQIRDEIATASAGNAKKF